MKTIVFIDGKNFYSGWRDSASGQRLDFVRLSNWLVKQAGGSVLVGAHYYTGIDMGEEGANSKLPSFLSMLERQRGFFVHRFAHKAVTERCESCGTTLRFNREKEVDTTMVADMLRLAAVNAYEILVLVSGDADHAPAVEGARQLGKIAHIATWGGSGLAPRLRRVAFDHIDLLDGLSSFVQKESEPAERIIEHDASAQDAIDLVFMRELAEAQSYFGTGFVGLNYFLTRWKADGFDFGFEEKRRSLERLVEDEAVEIYEVDGKEALRVRP
ncbi:MAG: NYN domain-containing protein [Myxococcota bacterium]|jgi:uncharacterized LabA/DUF88 family protein|nr:NYN domain-containing protein [Myxococcota bacterium]